MGDQIVTELTIGADTSAVDQYERSLQSADATTQKVAGSVADMSLAIAGVGAATIAAIAGLRSFVDYVGNQSQALVDMANHAQLAGMSVTQFQQTLYAAMASGISDKDFVTGLDKIGADLTDASRGATTFGKLFDANGISIKNANGELKTTNQAVADLAGLMQNASPQVEQAIAKIVGLSASWVPFLAQGVDGIEAQKKAALDLGIIIDDSTIAKAKEFNSEWHTAVAGWDLQFKAALASILPLLIQLANIASFLINTVGAIVSPISRWMTPDDSKSKQQLADQINDAERLVEMMTKAENQATSTLQKFQITNLQGLLGIPEGSSLNQAVDYLNKLQAMYDKAPTKLLVTPNAGTTVLPPGNDPSDALDRATDAAEKNIAKMLADADAVGQNVGALKQLEVEASLYAAATKAGYTDLEKYADQFYTLSQRAGDAALALEKAKVAANIQFTSNTMFLSPQDLAIATALKGIYGNDIPAAMASSEAAAMRVNNAIKDSKDTAIGFATTFVNGLLSGKSAMQSLVAAADQLATKLADKAITDLFSGNFIQAGAAILQQLVGDQHQLGSVDIAVHGDGAEGDILRADLGVLTEDSADVIGVIVGRDRQRVAARRVKHESRIGHAAVDLLRVDQTLVEALRHGVAAASVGAGTECCLRHQPPATLH
jgi:hypothetical protein